MHDRTLTLRRPLLVGILNLTPDSFSDGGRYPNADAVIEAAQRLILEGADILDVGAESSRPGAEQVPADEELRRLRPVLPRLLQLGAPVSVDTYKPVVAEQVLDLGAHLINDITGLGPEMLDVVARFEAPAIVMHMAGLPKTMQDNLSDGAVADGILEFLQQRTRAAAELNVQTIADIGFGFGKSVEQNLELLRDLSRFRQLGVPLLVGTSRKSTLGAVTGQPVDQRLIASIASAAAALHQGAQLLRVHDVAEHRELIQVLSAIEPEATPPGTPYTIQLADIPLDLHLGVPEAEREKPQRVFVDLELEVDKRDTAEQGQGRDHQNYGGDEIDTTVDYTDLPATVKATLSELANTTAPIKLLETLTDRIGSTLLETRQARRVRVCVHKPNAAEAIGCGDVILERVFARTDRQRHIAYVALGSNLGDRRAYLDAAVNELRRLGRVEACSEWIDSEPEGGVAAPTYLNGVVQLVTQWNAADLLVELLSIERRFGRQREAKTESQAQTQTPETAAVPAPRTLDLDLLLFDDAIIRTDDLIVPHPRMHLRSFVLEPLLTIAPDLEHPVLGRSIADLASDLR